MNDLKGWQIGDRVTAKERIPVFPGSAIVKGMQGTVINTNWQLCVKWDNFHGGHNSAQDGNIHTGDSLWWVWESAVELDGGIVENE